MSLRTKSITAARRSSAAITTRLDDYWMSVRIAEMKIPQLVATDAGMIKQHTIKLSDALASYHALKGIGKDVLFFTTSDRFCKYLIDALGDRHAARRIASSASGFAFPRYCNDQKCNSNSASSALNKWLKPRVPNGCVIHSFQHSLRDRLRAVECPADIIDAIDGWTTEGIGHKYGAGHDLEVKHRWMGRICNEYD